MYSRLRAALAFGVPMLQQLVVAHDDAAADEDWAEPELSVAQ